MKPAKIISSFLLRAVCYQVFSQHSPNKELSWIVHKGRIWRTDPDEPILECINDFFGHGISLVLSDSEGCLLCNYRNKSASIQTDVSMRIDTPERTLRAMTKLKESITDAHIMIPGSNVSDEFSQTQQDRYRALQQQFENFLIADQPKRRQVRRNLKFFISPPKMRTMAKELALSEGFHARLRGGGIDDTSDLASKSMGSPISITLRGFAPVCDTSTMRPDTRTTDTGKRFASSMPMASMEISSGWNHFIGRAWDETYNQDKDRATILNQVVLPPNFRNQDVHEIPDNVNKNHFDGIKPENFGWSTWWDEGTESSDSFSENAHQILNLRISSVDPAVRKHGSKMTTQLQSAQFRVEKNPFLGSSSDHSDLEADSAPILSESLGSKKLDKEIENSNEKLGSAHNSVSELLKKERLQFLSGGLAAGLDSSIQHGLNMRLWHAARCGSAGNVTLAVRSGAEVNSGDNDFYGWTALHRAADKGCDDVVRVLIHWGATVDILEAGRGLTPLHLAVHQGRVPVVRMLVAAGADTTKQDRDGVSPADLARFKASTSSRQQEMQVRVAADMDYVFRWSSVQNAWCDCCHVRPVLPTAQTWI
jgi:hypothetical protein